MTARTKMRKLSKQKLFGDELDAAIEEGITSQDKRSITFEDVDAIME